MEHQVELNENDNGAKSFGPTELAGYGSHILFILLKYGPWSFALEKEKFEKQILMLSEMDRAILFEKLDDVKNSQTLIEDYGKSLLSKTLTH